jgi:hypothetical protein
MTTANIRIVGRSDIIPALLRRDELMYLSLT